MRWPPHGNYVFLDLELTCALDNGIARAERETIEIGAVLVESATGKVISEFQEYVRPVLHKVLTPFCRELTGITQSNVDAAAFFPHVLERFQAWLGLQQKAEVFTWGNFDKKQLVWDCRRHGFKFPIKNEFHDFKNLFYKRQKLLKRAGLEASLAQVGFKFEGRPHSALADAKNTARLVRFVI